jgi:hypothetical protein
MAIAGSRENQASIHPAIRISMAPEPKPIRMVRVVSIHAVSAHCARSNHFAVHTGLSIGFLLTIRVFDCSDNALQCVLPTRDSFDPPGLELRDQSAHAARGGACIAGQSVVNDKNPADQRTASSTLHHGDTLQIKFLYRVFLTRNLKNRSWQPYCGNRPPIQSWPATVLC